MSRNYQNPPLVEALCEFQFTSDAWDWTIPGLLYTKIKENFPVKKQVKKLDIEINTKSTQVDHNVLDEVTRIQFINTEQTALVQAGPNLLAINKLRPYDNWLAFYALIMETLATYQEIAKPTGIKRIGLRFINRIEIPQTQFELEKFFNISPNLPDEIPSNFRSLFTRFEIPYLQEKGLLILTFGSIDKRKQDNDESAFILDLDFSTTQVNNSYPDEYKSWVDIAHSKIEEAFEACITDSLRTYFG